MTMSPCPRHILRVSSADPHGPCVKWLRVYIRAVCTATTFPRSWDPFNQLHVTLNPVGTSVHVLEKQTVSRTNWVTCARGAPASTG